MTQQSPERKTSFKDIVLGELTREEKLKLLSQIENDISDEEIQEAQKGVVTIVIHDFHNPRVKPFAFGRSHVVEGVKYFPHEGKAVYEVFCNSNKQITLQNGGEILTYFGNNQLKKQQFQNKELGSKLNNYYQDEQFNIRFKHYELSIPEAELPVIAKQLGKNPEEIKLRYVLDRLYKS